MKRRDFVVGLLGNSVIGRMATAAQPAARLPKLAVLSPESADYRNDPEEAINFVLARLAELGYAEGETIQIEFRFAERASDRLPSLAAELVATQPDVIYTWTTPAVRAAAAATSTVPIVVAPAAEKTIAALVGEFAHPVGNVTGLTWNNRQQHEKCLQLLKEVLPGTARVAVLVNPLNPFSRDYPGVLSEAAQGLGIELIRFESHGPSEIDKAAEAMAAGGVDAMFGLSDITIISNREAATRLAQLLVQLGIPSVADDAIFGRGGGLLVLGPDLGQIGRGAADYVDRILHGAKPADLPVSHPTGFRLIVNLKTAKALGIEIPPAVLLRADEVIE